MCNFEIFQTLLDHGSDIHEVDVANMGYNFPITLASAISSHQFITKLCQFGLDVSVCFRKGLEIEIFSYVFYMTFLRPAKLPLWSKPSSNV